MRYLLLLLVLWPLPGWGQPLRKPDLALQAQIRRWCSEAEPTDWPQRLMIERGVYLLHGNQAFLWYLSPEGEVFCLDTDRFAQQLEPETDLEAALEAVRQASQNRPELKALLPNP